MTASPIVRLFKPKGLVPYSDALKLMQSITQPSIVFLQHEPVYTAGRREHANQILDLPHPLVLADRGGQVTWHGPGQLVVYPCWDLRSLQPSLHWYVDTLEQVMREVLHDYHIPTLVGSCERGVWTKHGKIGFIGIRNRGWWVSHGIALNVNNDLTPFEHIVPCGNPNATITSMQAEMQRDISLEEVEDKVLQQFEKVFKIKIV